MATDLAHVQTSGFTNIGTTVETVVLTTPIVATGTFRAIVSAHINTGTGTGATALTIRIRQGNGTGGAIVIAETVNVTAGNTVTLATSWEDDSGILDTGAGGQYTLTLQQTAATANATVQSADLLVQIPN
jgi:hypothetical protein